MTTTPCEICDAWPGSRRYEPGADYGDGWVAAMQFAHHAHEPDLANGEKYMSANGVLGAPADCVIVDEDWLDVLTEKADYPLTRFEHWVRTKLRVLRDKIWWVSMRAVCLARGHQEMSSVYMADLKFCERCGVNL